MTSASAETSIIADVDGSHTGDAPGDVIWSGYTTDNVTAPAAGSLIDFAARDFLTFQGFTIIGCSGDPSIIEARTTTSTNITFRDCAIKSASSGNTSIRVTCPVSTPLHWLFDRCTMLLGQFSIVLELRALGSSNYDADVQFRNCLMVQANGGQTLIAVGSDGNGTGNNGGGGVDVLGCTILGCSSALALNSSDLSTANPCTAYGNLIWASGTALGAQAVGQLLEDFNIVNANTVRSNTTAGTNTHGGNPYPYIPLVEVGQSVYQQRLLRPFLAPMSGSPILGLGSHASESSVDFANLNRPAGGSSTIYAAGYLERHDSAVRETSTVDTGSNAINITGPGDETIDIPVDATAVVFSVRARYDTSHAATNKPRAILLANDEIGIVTQTVTMTAAANTWETLTFTTQTPTAQGIVSIRLESRSAANGGKAFFDSIVAT